MLSVFSRPAGFRSARAVLTTCVLLPLALVSLAATRGEAGKDPFEGTWKIEATADGAGKDFKDTITFKNDRLTAAALKTKGWETGEYDGDYRGIQVATFTATLKNKNSKAEMKWTGTLAVGAIKGSITIKADGKDDERYTYSGSKE